MESRQARQENDGERKNPAWSARRGPIPFHGHGLNHPIRAFTQGFQRTYRTKAKRLVQMHGRGVCDRNPQPNLTHALTFCPPKGLREQAAAGPQATRSGLYPHLVEVGDASLLGGQLAPDQAADLVPVDSEKSSIASPAGRCGDACGPCLVRARDLLLPGAAKGVWCVTQRAQANFAVLLPFVSGNWANGNQELFSLAGMRQKNIVTCHCQRPATTRRLPTAGFEPSWCC